MPAPSPCSRLPAPSPCSRLPARLASPPRSHLPHSRLPSSPIFLPPVSRHLPPPFPVSVLVPSPPPSLSPFSHRLSLLPCLRSPPSPPPSLSPFSPVSASFPVSVLPPSQPPSLSPISPVSASFPVSVLPPSRASSFASISRLRLRLRLPFFPFPLALRLCFFSVDEAAVEIQLRRSPLSSCGDPAPALPAVELSRSSSSAPCSRSAQSQRRVELQNWIRSRPKPTNEEDTNELIGDEPG
ncbi:hypothetical protein ACLOJK_014315 [Asimina triloba]